MGGRDEVQIEVQSPRAEDARAIVRAYLADVVSRYHGRPATAAELRREVREFAAEELRAPGGTLLVARAGEEVVGCAGMRFVPERIGELTGVFVIASMRRRGLASRLVAELEHVARERGVAAVRLDTRTDLVEARALYARLGYREVPAFNDGPHADHWFQKRLHGGPEVVWGTPAPELVTDRLRLEPVTPEHAEELWRALDDVRLHRFTGGAPLGLRQLRRRYAGQALGYSPDGTQRWCTWIVRERAAAAATGFVQATVPVGAGHSAELAWTIATEFQHRGYAREAAGAVAGWLRVHGVDELSALIHPDHAASGAVAHAIGLSPTPEVVGGELRWRAFDRPT